LANPSSAVIERGVELANNVIWEDRQITIQTVTSQQAADLPLRKEPSREGDLRVIEIDGFDLTPCGGTHASRTGEVGMIAVRHWERAKGMTRIEFVAGMRALADYRRANTTARDVASLFSSARDDAPGLAARMLDENKELHRRVRELEALAADHEAEELLRVMGSVSRPVGIADGSSQRIVSRVYSNRNAESLKQLAHALIAHENVVALLASNDQESARLVFAKSTDAAGDMSALMKEACALLEGRGGGKPDFAQGGGKRVEKIQEALALALKLLPETLLPTGKKVL
jgi:alanyl-tRNA synthetase